MDYEKNYSLKTEGRTLVFRTSSFRAEKSSVLHSGVYSREFTSILFASGICMLGYILLSPSMGGPALYTTLTFVLAAAFMLSHKFIFRVKSLEVRFNKQSGKAKLITSGAFRQKTEEINLIDIASVEIGSKRFEPENKDGADFVQKISVQHGSAVPGLGEPEEFVTLSLILKDGSERLIYAGNVNKEPEVPVQEIREFIFNQN
ncbi:hypothetical protein BMS3Abin09_00699 [bacterium BMS3Abin09]|nr:hypothetical protein BMS3Abin09_00699 [bacterium BMS3Abin09]GBE40505.1 hypothetical protein BMS3Bbin09_00387 [bacterium BMS3Bbin09]